ncbi:MAG TPA: class I SAM-dependent methyltransferase [Gammaproteobacteria bacterium]
MQVNEERLNSFVQQVFGDLSATAGGMMVALGDKLGLYRAMRGAGPVTSVELADRTGCAERYVREWLNSQAAAGYVEYHPESGSYELSPEQAMVLADETSPVFMPKAWEVTASMWLDEDKALQAFRSGRGVPWGDHNARLFCGTAAFFRNGYLDNLVSRWLPALDGVVEKLEKGANVADIGCGYGHSSVIMAKAFPNSNFFGFDSHGDSIAAAREVAKEEGVEDRVRFEVATAKSYPKKNFDLVCFFDCLHDMGDPVGAAAHAREALAKDGTVMLVEPFAGDRVEDNINPVGRMFYAASTTLCCAHSLSEDVGLALGAQAGEKRLGEVFREAGFTRFRRATETPFNLILEARA